MTVDTEGLAGDHATAGPGEKTHHCRDVLGAHKVSERALALVDLADLIRRHTTLSGIAINHTIDPLAAHAARAQRIGPDIPGPSSIAQV